MARMLYRHIYGVHSNKLYTLRFRQKPRVGAVYSGLGDDVGDFGRIFYRICFAKQRQGFYSKQVWNTEKGGRP